jgi:hypothetical protein
MNFIQYKALQVEFYTSLKDVERWLEIDLSDYDWHFSDVDGGWVGLEYPSWVPGEVLSAKLKEFDYQFIWAVISAFPKGTKPFLDNNPYADGNPGFWEGSPKKQIGNALFEIVCWDSSATLFIGLPDFLSKVLLKNAPGIKNLDEENIKRNCQ